MMLPLFSRSRRARVFAILRVLALLAVCAGASAALVLRATQAKAGDVLVELGAQLMRLPEAHYSNEVRRLSLNGLTLMLQSGSSRQPPEAVVRQFQAACRPRSAMQLDERERGALGDLLEVPWLRDAVDGLMVQERADGTAVACIDALGKPWDLASIVEATQRFAASGDLLELGRLRYAWVMPSERGSAFLTFWTEGSARLLEQFPKTGDAPGVDFPGLQRVPGSQRFLSAVLGESALVMYRHRQAASDELERSYSAALEAGGYRNVGQPATGEGQHATSWERARQHVIMVQQQDEQGSVLVTLLSQP